MQSLSLARPAKITRLTTKTASRNAATSKMVDKKIVGGWFRPKIWVKFCHGGSCKESDELRNLKAGATDHFTGGKLRGLTVSWYFFARPRMLPKIEEVAH